MKKMYGVVIVQEDEVEEERTKTLVRIKGGPGSGHYGHAGRPGKRGGSLPGVGFTRGSVPDGTGLTESGSDARLDAMFNDAIKQGMSVEDFHATRRDKLPEHLRDVYDQLPKTDAGFVDEEAATHFLNNQYYEGKLTSSDMGHLSQAYIGQKHAEVQAANLGWEYAGFDQRGQVKDKLVTDISEQSGLPYNEVNAAVKQWSQTSNDHDMRSLSLQEAVSEEFGVGLAKWQQGNIDGLRRQQQVSSWPDDPKFEGLMSRSQERTFVRTMYSNTQKQLRAAGIGPNDKVTLYRGYSPGGARFSTGEHVSYTGNAAESWSLSPQVASQFGGGIGGIVVKTQVEARNILGTALTGWGCLTEGEVVMFGSTGHDVEVHRGNN